MGYWFNNFQEFERKQKQENRLILNFYYVPDLEKQESPKRVKLLVKRDIRIPSKIISPEKVDKIKARIAKTELANYPLYSQSVSRGDSNVMEITIPYRKELIDLLPADFQTGNYDKILRLEGFYPERKASFSQDLEEKMNNAKDNEEIETSLENIKFDGFSTESELRNMPWLYLDIEKPLWKHDDEKSRIKAREKLLKIDKKLGNDRNHEKRLNAIKSLEEKLTFEAEGVGKIELWKEEYDASVSFIVSAWKNCLGEKWIRELYVLDPLDEFDRKEVKGYKVIKFHTEKELISDFIEKIKQRKPVLASGHNEVYDITQIRFASEDNKIKFNPAVKDINPRRDFVRMFFQRMREDLVYMDTLWLNAWHYPWLRQRTFSNLKLESVAKHHGLSFEKSMSHDELRYAELKRLYGKTKETREQGMGNMADYAAGDIEPVIQMIENNFLSLITKLKNVMPFCTLTEIAFHPNTVQKYHDKKHFDRTGNLRYHGYAQKERENQLQIFKKRFQGKKKKMLQWAGIEKEKRGNYSKVLELYLPFEEWLQESLKIYSPEFDKVYQTVDNKEKLPFLSWQKALERDMLTDYYFSRRDAKIFETTHVDYEKLALFETKVGPELLQAYSGSFHFLKNHFRSIYVSLNRNGRALIRTTKSNLEQIDIPEIMNEDADMFLLRKNKEEIEKMLPPSQLRVLRAFLTNFSTLDEIADRASKLIEDDASELIYIYNQHKRKQWNEDKFYKTWGVSVREVTHKIAQSYKNLESELKKYNTKVLDIKGDYLFVQADESIKQSKLVYVVRELEEYSTEKKDKIQEEEKKLGKKRQLTLFK